MDSLLRQLPCSPSLALLLLSLVSTVSSMLCPDRCQCSLYSVHGVTDGRVVTDCSRRNLRQLPDNLDPNVVSLDLHRNQIGSLPGSAFDDYKNLSYIDLSNNRIEVLGSRTFTGLKKIKSLNLSRNPLRRVESYAFSDISGHTSCSLTQPQCILDLTENSLSSVEEYAFNMVQGLGIKLGTSDTTLEIEPYAFYGARNIPEITIANIHPDLHLKPRVFTNTENIYRIKVANTKLYPIQGFTFEGLKGVREILFDECVLPSMKPYSFSGITYSPIVDHEFVISHPADDKPPYEHTNDISPLLTSGGLFNISRCQVDSLPGDLFKDTNLGQVNFQNNKVKRLEPHIFRGMTSPMMVTFRENSLENIQPASFGDLHGVRQLQLVENVMSVVPQGTFSGSKDIEFFSIHLRKASNLTIASGAFNGVFDVIKMEVVGDGLSHLELEPDAFSGMFGVEELEFMRVNIPSLSTHSFRRLRKVLQMRFVSCNVVHLLAGELSDMYDSMGGIGSLDLSVGNKLICDCQTIRVLREFDRTFVQYDVTCSQADGGVSRVTSDQPLPECLQSSSAASVGQHLALTAALLTAYCLL